MRKLTVFNSVTLDGYFTGPNGDLSWAHGDKRDAEWDAFVSANAGSGGELWFRRITYEMMVAYWPTPMALKNDRVVAQGMNSMPKVVFSKTLGQAAWANTRVVKGELTAEVRKMKEAPGPNITILGSGSIVSKLAPTGLIDLYQVVVKPMVLGKGRTMFDGIKEKLALKLAASRTFGNGNVLLSYLPL